MYQHVNHGFKQRIHRFHRSRQWTHSLTGLGTPCDESCWLMCGCAATNILPALSGSCGTTLTATQIDSITHNLFFGRPVPMTFVRYQQSLPPRGTNKCHDIPITGYGYEIPVLDCTRLTPPTIRQLQRRTSLVAGNL